MRPIHDNETRVCILNLDEPMVVRELYMADWWAHFCESVVCLGPTVHAAVGEERKLVRDLADVI